MVFSRKRLNFVSAGLAALTALVGDAVFGKQEHPVAKALVDNLTHALIACFTWISVLSSQDNLRAGFLTQIIVCGMIASLIDADHFIAAGSWRLMDATGLTHRPFLHCTSLIIFIASTFIFVGWVLTIQGLLTLGWIVAAAGISHHVRDATRRGFWLWFNTSTPPLPYNMYIAIIFIFPLCVPYVQNMLTLPKLSSNEFEV